MFESVMQFLGWARIDTLAEFVTSNRGMGISVGSFALYMLGCIVLGWQLSRGGLGSIEYMGRMTWAEARKVAGHGN